MRRGPSINEPKALITHRHLDLSLIHICPAPGAEIHVRLVLNQQFGGGVYGIFLKAGNVSEHPQGRFRIGRLVMA